AYEKLIEDVRADFAERGLGVPNIFGWRGPAQQLKPGSRINWVPGDHTSGDLGKVGAPKWPGRHPRPLGTLGELFTVTITGIPSAGHLDNEAKQYRETRLLFDAWYRAVYNAAHGTFAIQRAAWIVNRKERQAGAAIRVLLELQAKLSDATDTAAAEMPLGADLAMKLNVSPDASIEVAPGETEDEEDEGDDE